FLRNHHGKSQIGPSTPSCDVPVQRFLALRDVAESADTGRLELEDTAKARNRFFAASIGLQLAPDLEERLGFLFSVVRVCDSRRETDSRYCDDRCAYDEPQRS